MEKLGQMGSEGYDAEQMEKRSILDRLLTVYNNGRKKTLFCLAVNLLELDDLRRILEKTDRETEELPQKEKAAYAANLLQECAARSGVVLKLRKKPTQFEGGKRS